MTYSLEQMGKFLGKEISDPQGRVVGRMVGLTVDTKNLVSTVEVELWNGDVFSLDGSQVSLEGDMVVALPSWRVDAESMAKDFEVATKRLKAIELLLTDGDIDQETYTDLKKRYSLVLADVEARRDKLLESIHALIQRLDAQMKVLKDALANNKMLYSSGDIDDDTYRCVVEAIRASLQRKLSERNNIQNIASSLVKIRAQEMDQSGQGVTPPEQAQAQDVIVVKMREDN